MIALESFFAPQVYQTPAFTIRSYQPGDGVALQAAVVQSYDHLKASMPWATDKQTITETERIVRQFTANYLTHTDFCLGMFAPNGRLLGGGGFHLRHGPMKARTAEIGLWIRGDEASKGLGTAIVAAQITWAWSHWPWQRLVWKCDSNNIGSRKVAERNGFTLEGTMRKEFCDVTGERRDTCIYALLKPSAQHPTL